MFADGQRVERHEVEAWVAPLHLYFLARVTEAEIPNTGQVRVTVRINGPNGEKIVHPIEPNREAVYYSTRSSAVRLPQVESVGIV